MTKTFLTADFTNIEGRVLAWLAGEDWKMAAFRAFDAGTGEDLYKVAAAGIFGIPVGTVGKGTKRQVGKVSELALGYQGGVGAFVQMAPTYGLRIADHYDAIVNGVPGMYITAARATWARDTERLSALYSERTFVPAEAIKLAWRDKNPRIVAYWRLLNDAAIEAVKSPGKVSVCGSVKFRVAGSFLWLQLPSGRCLCYPYPSLKQKNWCNVDDADKGQLLSDVQIAELRTKGRKVTVGKAAYELRYKRAKGKTFFNEGVYGGRLSENITQAVARDLLAEAMLRVDGKYPIVMHVHDELVSEVDEKNANLAEYEALMAELPGWAAGCPVAASGWVGKRYRK